MLLEFQGVLNMALLILRLVRLIKRENKGVKLYLLMKKALTEK